MIDCSIPILFDLGWARTEKSKCEDDEKDTSRDELRWGRPEVV